MDTLSQVIRAVEWRLDLRGEGTKARHGRSDGFIMGGHREGSMQRLSMEGVSFNGYYVKTLQTTSSRGVEPQEFCTSCHLLGMTTECTEDFCGLVVKRKWKSVASCGDSPKSYFRKAAPYL